MAPDVGRTFTLEQLESRCAYWQQLLRLQDWTIFLRIQSQSRMDDRHASDVAGEIRRLDSKRQAWINLITPDDYPPNADEPQDMERTLVHELLHIHFGAIQGGVELEERAQIAEEQAIDAISRTLVALERGQAPA